MREFKPLVLLLKQLHFAEMTGRCFIDEVLKKNLPPPKATLLASSSASHSFPVPTCRSCCLPGSDHGQTSVPTSSTHWVCKGERKKKEERKKNKRFVLNYLHQGLLQVPLSAEGQGQCWGLDKWAKAVL